MTEEIRFERRGLWGLGRLKRGILGSQQAHYFHLQLDFPVQTTIFREHLFYLKQLCKIALTWLLVCLNSQNLF